MYQEPFAEPSKLHARARLFGGDFPNYELGANVLPGYLGGKCIACSVLRQKLTLSQRTGALP